MTPKKFRSKIDAWILILLIGIILMQIAVLVDVLIRLRDPGTTMIIIGATVLVLLLIGSLLLSTYYSIEGRTLRIVSGPFRWRVPIDEISSIERTRNPLSSPALSLDRLSIRYSGKKRVMISPVDRKRFLKALGVPLTK